MPAKRSLLITLFLTSSFLSAQQPDSTSPPPMFDVGTLSGNTYANECLGITFHIPKVRILREVQPMSKG